MIAIPQTVKTLINILEASSFEAYAVGGCVRDSLMNQIPNDWDICTSALPDRMKQCFKNFRAVETGLKHGTLTVIVDGEPYEITTFRKDGEYRDHRHPEQVEFVSDLQTDLSRRDFTVNAMAVHPEKGVVDFYGGIDDLNKKLIRCVGNPDLRFTEDALRIMRGVRFASTLGFSIEEETEKSILKNAHLLKEIAAERIIVELKKTVTGKNAPYIMKKYRAVFAQRIPEMLKYSDEKWNVLCDFLGKLPYDVSLRLSLLYSGIETDEIKNSLKNLKFEKTIQEEVVALKESLNIELSPESPSMCRFLNKLGEERAKKALLLRESLYGSQEENFKCMEQVLSEKICFTLHGLAVNGNDLRELGLKSGREIGETLNFLLEKVMNGEISNEKTALMNEIGKNLK